MRVLAARTISVARTMSVAAGVVTLIMAVPPFLIGAATINAGIIDNLFFVL